MTPTPPPTSFPPPFCLPLSPPPSPASQPVLSGQLKGRQYPDRLLWSLIAESDSGSRRSAEHAVVEEAGFEFPIHGMDNGKERSLPSVLSMLSLASLLLVCPMRKKQTKKNWGTGHPCLITVFYGEGSVAKLQNQSSAQWYTRIHFEDILPLCHFRTGKCLSPSTVCQKISGVQRRPRKRQTTLSSSSSWF